MMGSAKTPCRTPTTGRDGVTNIPTWKFDAIRPVILQVCYDAGVTGVAFSDLTALVKDRLPAKVLNGLGSLGWHVTTVKLELEVRGEIKRIQGVVPQRIILK